MSQFTPPTEFDHADLTGARFTKVHLNDARFRMVDFSGAQLRDVSLAGASIDGSDLDGLRIDGVEIAPLVAAELLRRDPSRAWREASDPQALRAAWAAIEQAWEGTYERAAALPADALDRSVEGEWSFNRTLRHLIFATDGWLGAVTGDPQPFHAWGEPFTELAEFVGRPVTELGIDPSAAPSYAEIREVRADRVARVRDFLATATQDDLDREVEGPPWEQGERLSIYRCLRVICNEECEHRRFAERDLDVLTGPA